jgi:ribonuclease HI
LTYLKEEELCHIAAITYGIWLARNKRVFEGQDLEDSFIINMATNSIRDYQMAITSIQNNNNNIPNRSSSSYNRANTRSDTNRGNQHTNHKWKKPRAGVIKANCDANLSIDGSWGLGAIFRDDAGQVMASATWVREGFNDPATAEAFAIYLSMRLAADCRFTSVEFESDCLNVVQGVNATDHIPRNYLGNIIQGIHGTRSRFRQASVKHIDRKANRAAHMLADLAHTSPNCIWLEETHPHIVPIVLMDLF